MRYSTALSTLSIFLILLCPVLSEEYVAPEPEYVPPEPSASSGGGGGSSSITVACPGSSGFIPTGVGPDARMCPDQGGAWFEGACPDGCKNILGMRDGVCCVESQWEVNFDGDYDVETTEYKIGDVYAKKKFLYNKQHESGFGPGGGGYNWNKFELTAEITNKLDRQVAFEIYMHNKISGNLATPKIFRFTALETKDIELQWEGDNTQTFDGSITSLKINLDENVKPRYWECNDIQYKQTPSYYISRSNGRDFPSIRKGVYEKGKVCYDYPSAAEIMDALNRLKPKVLGGAYWFYTEESTGGWNSPDGEHSIPSTGTYYLFYCDDGCRETYQGNSGCSSNNDCEIKNRYYESYGPICDITHIPESCVYKIESEEELPPEPEENIETEPKEEIYEEPNEASGCNGCKDFEKCYPVGTIISRDGQTEFCSSNKEFTPQKDNQAACLNNFECKSNFCSNQKCYDITREIKETKGLLNKLLNWLTSLF